MIQEDFSANIFYRILNYSYWFLMCNVYFFIFSLPLLIIIQFKWDFRNLFFWLLLFLTLLPIGPALTSSFSIMGKLVREKHISVSKDFFNSIRLNAKQAILLWSVQLIVGGVLLGDIYLLSDTKVGDSFLPLLYILLIINIIAGIYLYPLQSRFVIANIPILKMAFGYTLFKIKTTLLLLLLIGIAGLLLIYLPFMSVFFIIGPFCFLSMILLSGLLNDVEKSIQASHTN